MLATVVRNALHAQYGPDPLRAMQQRGLNWRRLDKQVTKNFRYHYTHRMMDEARSLGYGETWTSNLFEQEMEVEGSLAAVPFFSIRRLMLATRQRLTMQRFVAALKRLLRVRLVQRHRLR